MFLCASASSQLLYILSLNSRIILAAWQLIYYWGHTSKTCSFSKPSLIFNVLQYFYRTVALHGSMRTPFGNSVSLSELLTASGGSHDPYGSTGIWKCWLRVALYQKTTSKKSKTHFAFRRSCHLIPPKRHKSDIQKSKNDFSRGKKVRILPWKISFFIYI